MSYKSGNLLKNPFLFISEQTDPNEKFVYPVNFFKDDKEIKHLIYSDNKDETYNVPNFDMALYLYLIYDIDNIDDLIEWVNNNKDEPEKLINLVIDMTYSIYSQKDFNIDVINKLTEFYIPYFKYKFDKNIKYNDIFEALKEIKKNYIETNYKNSYQTTLKKILNI
jgi:hypothetical protein